MNEITPNKWIPNIEVRKYLYRVLTYALPLFGVGLGISEADLPAWIELSAAVLGIASGGAFALADANTPKKETPEETPAIFKDSDGGVG